MKTYSTGFRIISDIAESEKLLESLGRVLTVKESKKYVRGTFALNLLMDMKYGGDVPDKQYWCQLHSPKGYCISCGSTGITPISYRELESGELHGQPGDPRDAKN